MGLYIVMSFHQTDNVTFHDVNALNFDLLANTSFGELYQEINIGDTAYQNSDVYNGPVRFNSPSDIDIANISDSTCFEQYDKCTTVYGCYGQDVFDTFAKHMATGKLVFLIDIEGNDNEYWIIEPGKSAVKKKASAIRF